MTVPRRRRIARRFNLFFLRRFHKEDDVLGVSLRSGRPIRRSDLAGIALIMLVLGVILAFTSAPHHALEAIGLWIAAIAFLIASRLPSL